jgi:hypothetical protein
MARSKKKAKRKGFLHRQAQLRGLLGGSKPWTILWVLLSARRILKRVFNDEPKVVYSEELAPGQAVVISNLDREPKIIGADTR